MTVNLGWLDTNIFIHAIMLGDPHRQRCRDILKALEDDRGEGWMAPTVVHELSYVLARLPAFKTRQAIATYLTNILGYPGIRSADKPLLVATVVRWEADRIGFVDAYLTELAQRDNSPICSVNARDFPNMPNSYASALL